MTNPIVIIGFMGTGKTTVARLLAKRLGCFVVDLDQLITGNSGRSPREIIEQDGEAAFREIESRTLGEVFDKGEAGVVALGGGAWTVARNRELIAQHDGFTVWLDAPFDLCWRRIEEGADLRPLAPSREAAEKLYRERLPVYVMANLRIPVAEGDSAEDIALRITSR